MGQIPKLKYRKAHKLILSVRFGMVTHTGDQELSNKKTYPGDAWIKSGELT